jgi:lipopolysaccharide export system protein LptA
MMIRFFLVIIFCLAGAGGLGAAAAPGGDRPGQPIQIKSNELSTDSAGRTATFTGKVSARQGDVTIYCDKLLILYTEQGKDVDKVEAFGNVRVVQGDRTAQAGHAVYDSKGGKITLDDKPRVYQGEDEVTGKVITYYLDTQQSVVTGGPDEPVRARINPKEKRKDGGARP